MKLLIDQNISKRIIESISDAFSESIHVTAIQTDTNTDMDIWNFAIKNQLTLVTTDSDFFDLNVISDKSPKIIYVQGEVISTNKMEWALRVNQETIEQFLSENPATCLTINI